MMIIEITTLRNNTKNIIDVVSAIIKLLLLAKNVLNLIFFFSYDANIEFWCLLLACTSNMNEFEPYELETLQL